MSQEFKQLISKYQSTSDDFEPENHPDIEVLPSPDDSEEIEPETEQISQTEQSEINRKILSEDITQPANQITTSSSSYQTLTHSDDESVMQITKKQLNRSSPIERIRVLTYNIWFEDHKDNESTLDRNTRTMEIIKQIRKNKYEIVGLQEVVPETFKLINKSLKTYYQIFQVFINEQAPYGDLLLLLKDKIDIVEPYYYDYDETSMSRKIIGCEFKIKNFPETIHVLNTHLESLSNNKNLRAKQFKTIEKVVSEYKIKNVLLLGDFNISNTNELIESLLKQSIFEDVWVNMGCPDELKYTYDGLLNSNIKGKHRARFDRILYHFKFEHLVSQIRLIGKTKEIAPPSDHFGLMAEFVLSKNR